MEWVYCHERLPTEPGKIEPSHPVFVAIADFGNESQLAVARCWLSSLHPAQPKWYLDPDFYGVAMQLEIAEEVIAWMEIPELPRPLSLKDKLKLKRGAG